MSGSWGAYFASVPGILLLTAGVTGLAPLLILARMVSNDDLSDWPMVVMRLATSGSLLVAYGLYVTGRELLGTRLAVLGWLLGTGATLLMGPPLPAVALTPLFLGIGITFAGWFDARAVVTWAIAAAGIWMTAFVTRMFVSPAGLPLDDFLIVMVPAPAVSLLLLGWCIRSIVVSRDQARLDAEAASQAKSTFLANMSHELRTPLNAILGYTELVMEEAEDSGIEGLDSDLKRIHGASSHLLQLINDILDLSRIEAQRYSLSPRHFHLPLLIEEVCATARPLAEKSRNTLTPVQVGPIDMLEQDPRALRQVLFNLLSNACKFTEAGDITLEVKATPDGVAFMVRDTGIGMSPDQLERVFTPFVQATEETRIHYGGTGLGLSISRALVRAMGGELLVDSTEGAGTCFAFLLPRVAQPAEISRPPV